MKAGPYNTKTQMDQRLKRKNQNYGTPRRKHRGKLHDIQFGNISGI